MSGLPRAVNSRLAASAQALATAAARRQSAPRSLCKLQPLPAPTTPAATTFMRSPTPASRRMYSSGSPKSKNPSSEFYKTFGRPIAKVFLLAIFTYQVAYYFWTRLEHDEKKRELQATINELEARVSELEAATKKS